MTFALALFFPAPPSARAGGTVLTCTEAGLDAALASGGTVTFNCGGTNSPATITLTNQKTISVSTTINGGSVITLSGGSSTSLFSVTTGITLSLNAITVTQGKITGPGNGGCLFVNGTLIVNDTTITTCVIDAIPTNGGGGIYVNSAGRAMLTNVTIDGISKCTALFACSASGGGIGNNGILTLTNVTLSGSVSCSSPLTNSASCSASGGGITNGGTATLTNVTLSGSAASCSSNSTNTSSCSASGGGFYNSGVATLANVTFSGNSTGCSAVSSPPCLNTGGGIANNGTLTLTNVTLNFNQASCLIALCIDYGGGIYNSRVAALTNVTLSGNNSDNTGGIYSVVTLTNTIISKGSKGGNCNTTFNGGSSNLSDDNTCGFGAGRDNINIMLGPMANNGGFTKTRLPLPGSPAINFGTNTGCPATDQRGAFRPIGGICDVGAVEASYAFLPLIVR